jgi:hypothetical protein
MIVIEAVVPQMDGPALLADLSAAAAAANARKLQFG